MNLLDLVVKITCDDQASKQVESVGGRITSSLGTAAKVAAGAIAVVAGGVATIGASALQSYASYEQLVGGIDTLFKDSSEKMQQYAENAYQTAGVSANRYMEIATSFSASLLNSLGGDTEKAVEYANMAITDMSDNANKMGSNIEMIQETYQSLARGNYEMLDNLKLGYAGTKAGLEDLLADAEEYAAAQGEVRDFSVDSYADIVEAIHLVQEQMGIAGTTSQEAATTIEGSVNQMRAAWDNWLSGLGNQDADMSALTQQLLDSISTAASNVLPAVQQIGQTVVEALPSALAGARDALAPVLTEAVSSAWNLAVQAISGLGLSLPTIDTSTVQGALDALSGALQTLRDNADWLVPSLAAVVGGITAFQAASTIVAVVQGLQAAFTAWRAATEGMTIAQAALNAVMNANPFVLIATVIGTLVAAFITLMVTNEDFRNAVIGAWNQIVAVAQTVWGAIVNFFTVTVPQAIQSMLTWFQQLPGNIASFLGTVIANVASWVSSMASQALQAGSQFLGNVVNFFSQIPGRVLSFLANVISGVASWVGQMASQAAQAAADFGSSLIDGLLSLPGRVVEIGGQIVQGLVNGITGAAGSVIDAIGGVVNSAIDWAKGLLGIASPSKVFREIGQFAMQGAALGVDDDAPMLVQSTEDAMRGMVDSARSVDAPGISGTGSAAGLLDIVRAVESLHRDLGRIISRYAPYMTVRDFKEAVRSV